MLADKRPETDFLDPDIFLAFPVFPILFGFLILKLFIINELRDRRLGRGRNFYNVKIELLGFLECFQFGDNTYLFAIFVQQANGWTGDLVIQTVVFIQYAQSLLVAKIKNSQGSSL